MSNVSSHVKMVRPPLKSLSHSQIWSMLLCIETWSCVIARKNVRTVKVVILAVHQFFVNFAQTSASANSKTRIYLWYFVYTFWTCRSSVLTSVLMQMGNILEYRGVGAIAKDSDCSQTMLAPPPPQCFVFSGRIYASAWVCVRPALFLSL